MTGRRADNHSLRALLSAADWTYEALARAVNALGTENGARLRYDRTSVAHWLAGAVPRPHIRGLIAEAFTRRLRRPVTPADLGMERAAVPRAGAGLPAAEQPHAVARLAVLCAMDADPARRVLLEQSVYSAAGLDVPPQWEEPVTGTDTGTGTGTGTGGGADATGRTPPADDLAHMRAATAFFERAGNLGGRHARTALVAYLQDDVVPRLHAGRPGEEGRRIRAEAALLVRVLAGMYADDLKNGAAQHYHRAALHLAAESRDPLAHAAVLGAMAAHALGLGHHGAALRLCRAAERTAPAAVRPVLCCRLALAQAATGDHERAAASLARAEAAGGERNSPGAPGGCTPADLALWRGRALATLGDREAAVAALRQSLRRRPATAYRPVATACAELAGLCLAGGHVEEACTAWHRFLDVYPQLSSASAELELAELRAALRAHAALGPVRALLMRAGGVAERRRG